MYKGLVLLSRKYWSYTRKKVNMKIKKKTNGNSDPEWDLIRSFVMDGM